MMLSVIAGFKNPTRFDSRQRLFSPEASRVEFRLGRKCDHFKERPNSSALQVAGIDVGFHALRRCPSETQRRAGSSLDKFQRWPTVS